MKKTYATPKLSSHGTVAQITNYFGNGGGDVFRGPDNGVVATGNGSINACAQQSGKCIPNK